MTRKEGSGCDDTETMLSFFHNVLASLRIYSEVVLRKIYIMLIVLVY